jgi:tRNA(fMet)-specific endonuclease VapC
MTLYLIDTNIVSYIVRGRSPMARARLAGLRENEVGCISTITEGEIRYGLAKNPNAHLSVVLDGFLNKLRILPWGRDEAVAYGDLRVKLERSGKTLGNMDMLIAAQAISTDAVLVTNDQSFAQVGDLRGSVNWATDI